MRPVVNITNIPAPYREKMHEQVSEHFGGNYNVIYCSRTEPNRQWSFSYGKYTKFFLTERSRGYIHNNPSVWSKLNEIKPGYIITTGFNPTMLYAFAWCLLHRAKHICFADGTLNSEKNLSLIHKLIRKIVYSASGAFVGASFGSRDLYRNYGISDKKIFRSCLSIDNEKFAPQLPVTKEYDLMFSGQFIDRKMPMFFISVAKAVKNLRGTCRVLLIGDGELREQMLEELEKNNIEFHYPGFIDQRLLPDYYNKTRLLLFPSKNDPWGVVANEAMAAGVPVVTCGNAGVAHDLVIHDVNGYILPLEVNTWSFYISRVLNDAGEYESLSRRAFEHVKDYNSRSSARGIIESVLSLAAQDDASGNKHVLPQLGTAVAVLPIVRIGESDQNL